MARTCTICSHKDVSAINKALLSQEAYRSIAKRFKISESSTLRHKKKCLAKDLSDVHATMQEARAKALAEVEEKELAEIKEKAADSMASRLENAANFLDQLREVRRRAANLLDQAETSEDLKAAGVFVRELREQIRLWAELEGKLSNQPQINILVHPQWVELRTLIVSALEPYPEAKEAVLNALHK